MMNVMRIDIDDAVGGTVFDEVLLLLLLLLLDDGMESQASLVVVLHSVLRRHVLPMVVPRSCSVIVLC
jgi:hypothetical protein